MTRPLACSPDGPLDPDERIQRAIAVARAADPDGRRLLADLGRGDGFARRLAVLLAGAVGDADRLAAALGDPAPGVRARPSAAGCSPSRPSPSCSRPGRWPTGSGPTPGSAGAAEPSWPTG